MIRFASFDAETSTVVYHDADFGEVTIVFAELPDRIWIGPGDTIRRLGKDRFRIERPGWYPNDGTFTSSVQMTFRTRREGCPTCGESTVKVSGFATFTAHRDGAALSAPTFERVTRVVCASCGTPMVGWGPAGGPGNVTRGVRDAEGPFRQTAGT